MRQGDTTINHPKVFGIGEFAHRAGVTIRTIRYYDKLGLLKPSAYTESGRRLYSEMDFAKLQQILTLKFIGLSLEEISRLLTTDTAEINQLLEQQKQVLKEKAKQLAALIQTIEESQLVIRASQNLDWEQFVRIIKAVKMNQQSEWFSQFISDEQQEKLATLQKSWTIADQKKAGQSWKSLFEDIRASMGKAGPDETQKLAARWAELVNQFAQGDADFEASLTNAYAHLDMLMEDASPEVKQWTQEIKEAAIFIQKLGNQND
jgi:MerR family transcriptional regulator, thiopeptide resistance regulator